jgi:hypothetical protein
MPRAHSDQASGSERGRRRSGENRHFAQGPRQQYWSVLNMPHGDSQPTTVPDA